MTIFRFEKNRPSRIAAKAQGTTVLLGVAALFSLMMLFLAAAAAADDFSQALDKINKIKPNIQYSSFCSDTPSGEDKIACRMNSVPAIGLLVCKKPDYNGKTCVEVIREEVNNLAQVKKAGLNTVDFAPSVIEPLKCAEQKSNDCAGYLVRWVTNGRFVNLDDAIAARKIADLANDIVQYTPSARLARTRGVINDIVGFMAPGDGKYSRICDLQGFYLHDGGFLINDVPSLALKVSDKPACWAGMPSYDTALDGLRDLGERLR